MELSLVILAERFAICRLAPDGPLPECPGHAPFWSLTRAGEGLSIVLPEEEAPKDWKAERGWRCIQVVGPLDLNLVGVLASLAASLAQAGVSLFAVSTYDTDYVLVREEHLAEARRALLAGGHRFVS